jgi:hypothetical protein
VGSGTETAAALIGTAMRSQSKARAAVGPGRPLFDLLLTTLLLALLIFGALHLTYVQM